jgi:tetratricopeptide (TPR) repeat protein
MGAVTYPNEKVAEFVEKHMVPVQVLFNAQPLATDFKVKWTPTVITLDEEGNEHHRTVGFLSPEEFIPSLMLGMGKAHFDREKFEGAMALFDRLLKDYPQSDAAPEAVYLRGVAQYKSSHSAKPLKEAYERLQAEYPSSEWTKRAQPYRLL